MRVFRYLSLLFAAAVISTAVAQTSDKIEQQRSIIANLEKQVAEGEVQLAALRNDRAAKEKQAKSLAQQVETRNRLLAAQRKEESILSSEIKSADKSALELTAQLAVERGHYALMVQEAWRGYNNHNMLTYLFTAKDFQDVARKISNMRAMAQLRAQKIDRIDSLSAELVRQRELLVERKSSHDKVIGDLTVQMSRLQRDVNSAKANISAMSARERQVLKESELHQRQLDDAVKELQKLVKGNQTGASFSGETSNLNLPVVGGRVKQYMENMAEIIGGEAAKIISIYDGKVVDVRRNRITGKYDIYIAHGEYITSYAGLSVASVAKDQIVKKGEQIGVIGVAVDIITMQSEYKIVFGIYPPTTAERVSAASCFKK